MTDCNSTSMHFSPLNRKKIVANFNGGDITSEAGLLLLREVDRHIGLTKAIAKAIHDPRSQGYVIHSTLHMLRQRVYALAAGYEDINDHDTLRHNLCFQTAVGREVNLASSSTLSRFENAIDRQSLVQMSQVLVEHFIQRHNKPPHELVLDFDPTDHVIYGHQDQRHYHGYYRDYCYLPLHVFCGDHLLVSLLRPSNIDAAKYAGSVLRLLVKRLRQAWPHVRITFRGDSAFARKRFMYWCEHHSVDYITGIAGNSRLKALANPLVTQAAQHYEQTQTKQRLFGDYQYSATSWKQTRRVIAKVEHHDKGTNCRFVITNKTTSAQALYDEGYCPRGDMENGIKQLKLDLHSDRNSCQDFLANQCRVLLSSIAYILLVELREESLQKTPLTSATCKTMRLKLLKIGGIIVKNTRRIQVMLSHHYPYQASFKTAVTSLVPP